MSDLWKFELEISNNDKRNFQKRTKRSQQTSQYYHILNRKETSDSEEKMEEDFVRKSDDSIPLRESSDLVPISESGAINVSTN